jgi:uncharacterized Ntn-hydrolase superfamily protein
MEVVHMAELTTFSITGLCPRSGMVGIGVASRFLAVGALCPHVGARVGAVATQAMVNPLLGVDGLALLARAVTAPAVLAELIGADAGQALRQVCVVDMAGRAAAHTGADCVPWAGHRTGEGYAIAGNMLAGPAVLEAMEQAWLESADRALPERLLLALEAGQVRGGDKRGKQAAALLVAQHEEYPFVDLRVDDHVDPLPELRRLWLLSEETFAPYRELLPCRANPSGVTSREAIEAVRARVNRTLR